MWVEKSRDNLGVVSVFCIKGQETGCYRIERVDGSVEEGTYPPEILIKVKNSLSKIESLCIGFLAGILLEALTRVIR